MDFLKSTKGGILWVGGGSNPWGEGRPPLPLNLPLLVFNIFPGRIWKTSAVLKKLVQYLNSALVFPVLFHFFENENETLVQSTKTIKKVQITCEREIFFQVWLFCLNFLHLFHSRQGIAYIASQHCVSRFVRKYSRCNMKLLLIYYKNYNSAVSVQFLKHNCIFWNIIVSFSFSFQLTYASVFCYNKSFYEVCYEDQICLSWHD